MSNVSGAPPKRKFSQSDVIQIKKATLQAANSKFFDFKIKKHENQRLVFQDFSGLDGFLAIMFALSLKPELNSCIWMQNFEKFTGKLHEKFEENHENLSLIKVTHPVPFALADANIVISFFDIQEI